MAEGVIMALKRRAIQTIESHTDEIVALGRALWACPELGYREYRTSALMRRTLETIGLSCAHDKNGYHWETSLRFNLNGRTPGPTVAVMAELDAVICRGHPDADPETGAVHACGHHAQLAALYGVALGLHNSGIMAELSGSVALLAVPAEEYIDLDYRSQLLREGRIKAIGGKQHILLSGGFQNIDMAMMIHSLANCNPLVQIGGSSQGFIGKRVRFIGREAHAGGAPHMGINALNAATIAIQCIHALRETFQDEDGVRVHPIITKGGELVNTVPADVRMECYVRARRQEAVTEANQKVNRAIQGACYAMGVECDIIDSPGYLPLQQNKEMTELFDNNACTLVGSDMVQRDQFFPGATDAGDVSHTLPTIHPCVGGFNGLMHGADFTVCNEEAAYILPAKLLASMTIDLLINSSI